MIESLRRRIIEVLYRAAISNRRNRTLLTPIGLLIFLGFMALVVTAAQQIDQILQCPPLLPVPLHIILSLPLLLIGLALLVWSYLYFFKAKGTPVPFNPPPQVVISGPYAHVRNPMISGALLLLLGGGLLLNSITLVLLFVPLLSLLAFLELKWIEEPELEKRLGAPYLEYKRNVPMFLPRFRRLQRIGR